MRARKSRWLFLDADVTNQGIGFRSLLGKSPYGSADLAAILSNLKRMSELARTRGVKLLIAVCPDKQTVYPEYLPARMRPKPGTISRLDQFWAAAAGLEGVSLVDLRIPLAKAKGQFDLYYPTDTHWNWRGAMVGYETIATALQAQDSTWEPVATRALPWRNGQPSIGDLTKLMGLPTSHGDEFPLVTLPKPEALGSNRHGKLLVLGDSFFNSMAPYFELQFDSVKKMDGEIVAGAPWLSPGLLDAEKPDVVLVESIERHWTKP